MKPVITNRTEEDCRMQAKQLYVSGEYEKANPTWHGEDSPWKVEQIFRVYDFQPQNQPMKICDIGCGVGGVLATLYDLLQTQSIYADMTGYDISPFAIEHARKKL